MTKSRARMPWGLLPKSVGLGALLVTTAHSNATLAQSAEDKAAADALFDAARAAMDAKDYASACPKFADSQKLDPGVGTLLNLARCYDLSGRTGSAYSTYREAAAMARAEGQADREELARKEVARLEGKLTRLVLVVGEEVRAIEGLTIERAGQVIPSTMWGVTVPVDPGPQEIQVSAPGYEPSSASVNAQGEGQTVELLVPLLEKQAADAAPAVVAAEQEPPREEEAPPAPSDPEDGGQASGPGIAPWIVGGLGIAAVGVGTGFALKGLGENNKAKDICVNVNVCPAADVTEWWNARDAAQTNYTIAYIGWGVGAAAIVGSVVWLVLGRKKSTTSALHLTPVATGDEFGLIAGGRF